MQLSHLLREVLDCGLALPEFVLELVVVVDMRVLVNLSFFARHP